MCERGPGTMRRILLFCCIVALALAALVSVAPARAVAPASASHLAPGDLPAVDPDYVYNQLFTMATRFQHREAGYDAHLPPLSNGHDELAAYWTSEMQTDLAGFGATVTRDSFAIAGWPGRPATTPAVNVEVTVPGMTHPDQIVIIGCHYDGEAISTQSANDDASGCAIELGVAKAMGAYWHAHSVYPARTLRFVLYDAEEQGLFGSFHAANATVNGDLGNVVAMFNEEQSGIGYPLRFLGNAANPMLRCTPSCLRCRIMMCIPRRTPFRHSSGRRSPISACWPGRRFRLSSRSFKRLATPHSPTMTEVGIP